MTTLRDALDRVSVAAAHLAADPTDSLACLEYDAACAALDLVRLPNPAQVAELRELLDLMAEFADNDQRARFLLTSDWGRANVRPVPAGASSWTAETARLAAHLEPAPGVPASIYGVDYSSARNLGRPARPVCADPGPHSPDCVVAASANYVPGVSGIAVTGPPAPVADPEPVPGAFIHAAHGYGAAHPSWAPGYCWCGVWALDGQGPSGSRPCATLTAILGRPPHSHTDAARLAYLRGVDGSAGHPGGCLVPEHEHSLAHGPACRPATS